MNANNRHERNARREIVDKKTDGSRIHEGPICPRGFHPTEFLKTDVPSFTPPYFIAIRSTT